MKIKLIYTTKVLFTAFLVICTQYEIFSQITDYRRVKHAGLFFGFNGGPSQTSITNKETLSVSGLLSNRMNAYFGSVEIGYFFSRHIGLSTGIGFDSYKTQLTLNSYENNFNTVDSENEPYERQVTGININEVQEIGFIYVPIYLNFRLPLTKSKSVDLFLQAGANLAVPISKNYTSNGTFTYKGYYPKYNVLFENLPDFGFIGNHNTVSSGELKLQQYNFNAIGSGGFDIFIQKKIQLAFAVSYSQSLTNISAYDLPDKFQLSSDVDQMNSLMGGCRNVSLQSMGIKISLRYFLRSTSPLTFH